MVVIEVLKFTKEQEGQYAELIKSLDKLSSEISLGETYKEIRNSVMQYSAGYLSKKSLPFSTTFLKLEEYAKIKYDELIAQRSQQATSANVVNDIEFLFS